jgi:hypothetical protein
MDERISMAQVATDILESEP